ncbi:hypothetical protein GCM10023187_25950 [Nibrella viscosa]|uniref:DinB-like domain-containing protein n=1 Tax=Nibrella viscosa TaxID=1084524 RepID=A0ABP8KH08_9BACT
MIDAFTAIYERDLDRLQAEIDAFQEESHVWQTTGSIKNSAGNLCLHLVGNLNTYIGKNIGGHPYSRDRDAEFSLTGIPKQELLAQVEQTKAIVTTTLRSMDAATLDEIYPEAVFGYSMKTGFFLLHLAAHLSYHLGQINYIRRVFE